MGYVYGPWQTTSLTVDGCSLGAPPYTVFSASMRRATSAGDGFGGLGSVPWRDPAFRVAVADQARTGAFSVSGNAVEEGSAFTPVPAGNPDTSFSRKAWSRATAGFRSVVTVDHTFGLFYEAFDVTMYLGEATFGLFPTWLAGLAARPASFPTATPKPLTGAEWSVLWAGGNPDPDVFDAREVDVYACTATVTAATGYDTSAPTGASPTLTRHLDSPTPPTTHVDWYNADDVYPLPGVPVTDGSSWTVGGAWGTGPDAPTYAGAPLPPGSTLLDSQLGSLTANWVLDGRKTGSLGRREFVTYDPHWPTGVDPGYDEAGADANNPGGGQRTGGDAASHWAQVRLTTQVTYTVRYRWVGYRYGTPPLWQRGRIGAMDSPEQYSSGLVTPQSSPWQAGMP